MKRNDHMNTTSLIRATTLGCATALLLALGPAVSATTAAEVTEEVKEAMAAIASYGAGQRDEAVAEASEAMTALDRRLEAIEQDLETRWESMDALARQKARLEMARLRVRRNKLSEWYGGIKHGSANAWDHVKDGFAESYRALSDALADARNEF